MTEPGALRQEESAVARMLCRVRALTAEPSAAAGTLWKLAEPGRQLDANLIRLSAGERIGTHAEPDLDVLLLVVAGDGVMDTAEGPQPLADGVLMWLPHRSVRGITAGPEGLAYLTVHGRRPGMQIGRRTGPDPATEQPGGR